MLFEVGGSQPCLAKCLRLVIKSGDAICESDQVIHVLHIQKPSFRSDRVQDCLSILRLHTCVEIQTHTADQIEDQLPLLWCLAHDVLGQVVFIGVSEIIVSSV